MDCKQAQEMLLGLDRPAAAEAMAPELRGHVSSCSACQAYAAKLVRLESMVAGLAMPAESATAKQAFAQRLRLRIEAARPRAAVLRRRIAWSSLAAAAVIALGAGLGLWFMGGGSASAQAALDDLVQLNLQLAGTPDVAQRATLFHQREAHFRRWMERRDLTPEQKEQAGALLKNCDYLVRHADPLDEAEGFSKLSQGLLSQAKAADRKGIMSPEHLRRIERLRREGIAGSLKRFQARNHASEDHAQDDRARDLLKRDQEVAAQVKALLDQSTAGRGQPKP